MAEASNTNPHSSLYLLERVENLCEESRRTRESAQDALDRAQRLLHPLQPAVSRSVSGNGEERAAQVERIQERLDRLRRFAEHLTTEVAEITKDVQQLTDARPLVPDAESD